MFLSLARAVLFGVFAVSSFHSLLAADLCVRVTDYSDLPLPKVTITATSLANGIQFEAHTSANGEACVPKLTDGLYAIEAGLPGFMNVRYYPVRVAYPSASRLFFRLPLSEVSEGGMFGDAYVSGTLRLDGKPMGGAQLCAVDPKRNSHCVTTTGLGEYALALAPGAYQVEIRAQNGDMFRLMIDAPSPDVYRDLVSVKESDRWPSSR
jgi:hypothetical protein